MNTFDEKKDATVTVRQDASADVESGHSGSESALPSDPHTLEAPKKARALLIIFDIVLVLTPLALVCKTILCIAANHVDRNASGDYVDQVSNLTLYLIRFNAQLTTLFTIIFVTIISTFVRRVALWRAQKGASVAELEQWQASISLPSTLKTIWSLRMFGIKSVLLVVIWAWYYLGSQASVREYTYQISDRQSNFPVTITNPQGPSPLDTDSFGTVGNSVKAFNNGLYSVAINSHQAKGYAVDGAPFVPVIESVLSSNADRHGFLDVQKPSNASYASYVGEQIFGVFPDVDFVWKYGIVGTVKVNTSYLSVQCAPAQARNISEFPAGVLPTMAISMNVTARHTAINMNLSTPKDSLPSGPATFDLWYRVANSSAQVAATSSACNITNVPLQVIAECSAAGCQIRQLKPMDMNKTTTQQTAFQSNVYAARFYNEMLLATGIPSNFTDLNAVQSRIRMTPYFDTYPNDTEVRMEDVDILTAMLPGNIEAAAGAHGLGVEAMREKYQAGLESIAQGMGQNGLSVSINSYLSIWQQTAVEDTIKAEQNNDAKAILRVFSGDIPSPWLIRGELKGNYFKPQYALSIPWIVIDFISCGVLLIAGILGVYLRTRILAPDIFGYVSSLTIDNPHIAVAQTSSTLSGMERAKMLKNVKIQIVDVDGQLEIGRVGLAQKGCHLTSRLNKQKLYQ